MILSILNRVKCAKNENEVWESIFAEVQKPNTFCTQIDTPSLPNVNMFIIHRDNEALVVMCDFAMSKLRNCIDELIDEVAFAHEEAPLWFTEQTHRTSPVYHLRRYIKATESAFEMGGFFPEHTVKGLLLVNTSLINYIDKKAGYEKMGIVIKDKFTDPLRRWDSNYLQSDAFLDFAVDLITQSVEDIIVPSMSIPDDDEGKDPYIATTADEDKNYDSEEEEDDDDNDDDDIYMTDEEWEKFAADLSSNKSDDNDEEADNATEEDSDEDKGRITTSSELRKFLRQGGTTSITSYCDDEIPNVEIYYPLPNAQAHLDGMTGLQSIKDKILDFSCLAQYNRLKKKSGTPYHTLSLHAVFTGNPGTGKSTMGRIWAGLLRQHDQLTHGHMVLATRSSFIGTKWGMEEENLTKILNIAEGGVLMIDEAYNLVSAHPMDPGRLILPMLLNRLADESHRNISVILAGYPAEMESLLKTNPGITSRFPNVFDFKDFTLDELCDITLNKVKYFDYTFTPSAWERYREILAEAYSRKDRKHFGNARFVVNYLERVYLQHAKRIVGRRLDPTLDANAILRITEEDIVPCEQRQSSGSSIGFDIPR